VIALLLAASFAADYPQAATSKGAGGLLTHASGFEARGVGDTPQAAAAAFLKQYGDDFGLGARQVLVPRGGSTAVRFERQIDGMPVFGGDLVVGIGAGNSVILVNGSAVPAEAAGTFRLSRKAAVGKALKALSGTPGSDEPRAVKGWKPNGETIRPAWRVDVTTSNPDGDWRLFVDAETGAVLSRTSLRSTSH
jgi:Zn-dependent metalloprotease